MGLFTWCWNKDRIVQLSLDHLECFCWANFNRAFRLLVSVYFSLCVKRQQTETGSQKPRFLEDMSKKCFLVKGRETQDSKFVLHHKGRFMLSLCMCNFFSTRISGCFMHIFSLQTAHPAVGEWSKVRQCQAFQFFFENKNLLALVKWELGGCVKFRDRSLNWGLNMWFQGPGLYVFSQTWNLCSERYNHPQIIVKSVLFSVFRIWIHPLSSSSYIITNSLSRNKRHVVTDGNGGKAMTVWRGRLNKSKPTAPNVTCVKKYDSP